MNAPVLYIFSGLPASGKSTVAELLARRVGATYVRIDTIEQALRDLCAVDVQDEGYRLAYRLVADNLRLGNSVVADSCNPIELTRREWERVATDVDAQYVNIEIVCSNVQEHRTRVETRRSPIQGLRLPTWQDVIARAYDRWTTGRVVVDTFGRPAQECVDDLLAAMGSGPGGGPDDVVVSGGQTMQKKVAPMFHVPDVRRTVDWYRDIGFDVRETYDDNSGGLSFALVSFGTGEVMFSSGGKRSSDRRRDADLYVYTEDVDGLYARLQDRVEIVEGPHNMFYGMREVIVRDLNGFWITFGQELPADALTPWPPADAESLRPYAGKYRSDAGPVVLITIHEGRLLAFPADGSGVFLRPAGERTFTPMMPQEASVVFEGGTAGMTALTFQLAGNTMRYVRVP